MAGDQTPWVFLKTPFDERNGRFSPDGRFVAYASNESERPEIYVRPFARRRRRPRRRGRPPPQRVGTGRSRPQAGSFRCGRFLINTVLDEGTAVPITLLMNWQPPVKK